MNRYRLDKIFYTKEELSRIESGKYNNDYSSAKKSIDSSKRLETISSNPRVSREYREFISDLLTFKGLSYKEKRKELLSYKEKKLISSTLPLTEANEKNSYYDDIIKPEAQSHFQYQEALTISNDYQALNNNSLWRKLNTYLSSENAFNLKTKTRKNNYELDDYLPKLNHIETIYATSDILRGIHAKQNKPIKLTPIKYLTSTSKDHKKKKDLNLLHSKDIQKTKERTKIKSPSHKVFTQMNSRLQDLETIKERCLEIQKEEKEIIASLGSLRGYDKNDPRNRPLFKVDPSSLSL